MSRRFDMHPQCKTLLIRITQLLALAAAAALFVSGAAVIHADETFPPASDAPTTDVGPTLLWVDDDWLGLPDGTDPDGPGPAMAIGYDAFAAVQSAIDAATEEDTIMVAAGLYREHITIDKSVILTPAIGAVPVLSGDVDQDSKPDGVVVTIAINRISISGFEIQDGYYGIYGCTSTSNISQNVVHDNAMPNAAGAGIAVWGHENNISANHVFNNGGPGIRLGAPDGRLVSLDNMIAYNIVHDNRPYRPASGAAEVQHGIQTWHTSGGIIQWNTVFGHSTLVASGINLIASQGTAIQDNDIHSNTKGVWLDAQSADTYLVGNVIHDNAKYGVVISGKNASALANFNQFCRNGWYSVYSDGGKHDLDATFNWWGSAAGPQGGDKISAGIEPWPWNKVPPTSGPCQMYAIHAFKYEDMDGNGIQDPGDPGLNGWQFTLYDIDNNPVAESTTQTIGDEKGWALFENVLPGDYQVCENLNGWVNSDPGDTPCQPVRVMDYAHMPGSGPLFALIDHPGDDEFRLIVTGLNLAGLTGMAPINLDDPALVDLLHDPELYSYLSEPWLCLAGMLTIPTGPKPADPLSLDPRSLIPWDPAHGFDTALYTVQIESDYLIAPLDLYIKQWRGQGGFSTATGFLQCGAGVPTVAFGNYKPGTITILKDALGAFKGERFAFASDLGSFALQDGGSKTFQDLTPGAFTFSEDPASLAGEDLGLFDIVCMGEKGEAPPQVDIDLDSLSVDVTLLSGQNITCVFQNERVMADLDSSSPSLLGTETRLWSTSVGSGLTYKWDFGDGTAPVQTTSDKVRHVYGAVGKYTATLTVWSRAGTSTATTEVEVLAAPKAQFVHTNLVQKDQPISVENSSDDGGDDPTHLSYSWDFGDGTWSNDKNPTHVFKQVGTFLVKLTVHNRVALDTATQSVTVLTLPNAQFEMNKLEANADESILFTNTSDSGGDQASSVSYTWDFGDGTSGTDANPTHTYTQPGTFTVQLRAQNRIGSHTTSKTVLIKLVQVDTGGGCQIYLPLVMR